MPYFCNICLQTLNKISIYRSINPTLMVDDFLKLNNYAKSVKRIREIRTMKKTLLTIVTLLFTTFSGAFAAENFLNTVILEGTGNTYNVILRSDAAAMVKRVVENNNKITLEIKGLTSSDNISTLYRNTSAANGVIVENVGSNAIRIHVQGKNIASANIIFDTPATAPIVVTDKVSKNTIGWSLFALAVLCFMFAKSREIKVDPRAKAREAMQKSMRDREIAMYKNYRREMLTMPSIDYKIKNPRMKQAIRRADTIRHLQRVSAGK